MRTKILVEEKFTSPIRSSPGRWLPINISSTTIKENYHLGQRCRTLSLASKPFYFTSYRCLRQRLSLPQFQWINKNLHFFYLLIFSWRNLLLPGTATKFEKQLRQRMLTQTFLIASFSGKQCILMNTKPFLGNRHRDTKRVQLFKNCQENLTNSAG